MATCRSRPLGGPPRRARSWRRPSSPRPGSRPGPAPGRLPPRSGAAVSTATGVGARHRREPVGRAWLGGRSRQLPAAFVDAWAIGTPRRGLLVIRRPTPTLSAAPARATPAHGRSHGSEGSHDRTGPRARQGPIGAPAGVAGCRAPAPHGEAPPGEQPPRARGQHCPPGGRSCGRSTPAPGAGHRDARRPRAADLGGSRVRLDGPAHLRRSRGRRRRWRREAAALAPGSPSRRVSTATRRPHHRPDPPGPAQAPAASSRRVADTHSRSCPPVDPNVHRRQQLPAAAAPPPTAGRRDDRHGLRSARCRGDGRTTDPSPPADRAARAGDHRRPADPAGPSTRRPRPAGTVRSRRGPEGRALSPRQGSTRHRPVDRDGRLPRHDERAGEPCLRRRRHLGRRLRVLTTRPGPPGHVQPAAPPFPRRRGVELLGAVRRPRGRPARRSRPRARCSARDRHRDAQARPA
jgi:hypothetical protein